VLVNDGSSDDTPAVIERALGRAPCRFAVVSQSNGGLAKARNAGIARATGERIVFIDDDVLVLPNFVAEHLRSHDAHPRAIVRGGAIDVESFDDLPPPVWSIRNYSGNYFWTTNVSAPMATIRAAGGFDESFSEYGWEDIELGLRLRRQGTKAIFNPNALAYHYKPRPRTGGVERMVRQARAQARTAVILARLHPNWRTYLATGNNPIQRGWHRAARRVRRADRLLASLGDLSRDRELSARELRAARALAAEVYFAELEASLRRPSP
jgi:glycosyltransferase involved in cell wall biosynthesis